MTRTRSGMLDRFDLTGVADSEDDGDADANAAQLPETYLESGKVNRMEKTSRPEAANYSDERNPDIAAAAIADATPIDREDEGRKPTNVRVDPIPSSAYRPAVPSLSSQITTTTTTEIEIVGESSPGTNPFLDYPHRREDCQRFGFASLPERMHFCGLCYCYICDIPSSQCLQWKHHCSARHSDPKSRLQRKSVQIRKNTLRPRKGLLPPHRLRSCSPETAVAKRNHLGGTAESSSPSMITNRALKSSPVRTVSIDNSIELVEIPSSTRTLRPRNGLQPPLRLRSSSPQSLVLADKSTKETQSPSIVSPPLRSVPQRRALKPRTKLKNKKNKALKGTTLSVSPPPKRNLFHDLFLPGKGRQTNASPAATAEAMQTTLSDRTKGSSPVVKAYGANKRKRHPNSSAPKTKQTKSPSVSKTPIPMVTSHSKTRKPPIRSHHYTRSSHKINAMKVPEIYGTLGAYWRGEPTKYAGVPYQIRTNSSASRATPKPETETVPTRSRSFAAETIPSVKRDRIKRQRIELQRSTTPETSSESKTTAERNGNQEDTKSPKRARRKKRRLLLPLSMLPLSSARNRATRLSKIGKGKSSLPQSKKARESLKLSIPLKRRMSSTPTRNDGGEATSGVSRTPTPMTMPGVVNPKGGRGLTPASDASGSPTFTATLEGRLSYDSDSRRYSILGTWHCPSSKSFPPQKFGLLRSLRVGEKGPKVKGSSFSGRFDGYCVVTTKSLDKNGEPLYHDRLVFESDVLLEFKRISDKNGSTTNPSSKNLEVHGSGTNKFGAFLIHGTAKPCTNDKNIDNDLYTIVLQKRYLPNHCAMSHSNVVDPKRQPRRTRSNSIYGNGIIVRKRFANGNYCEGEVVGYDPDRKRYKIKYIGGDHHFEDFDEADMKKYYKHLQRYSFAPEYTTNAALAAREKLLYSWFVDNNSAVLAPIK